MNIVGLSLNQIKDILSIMPELLDYPDSHGITAINYLLNLRIKTADDYKIIYYLF
jgi:hypothetical protein